MSLENNINKNKELNTTEQTNKLEQENKNKFQELLDKKTNNLKAKGNKSTTDVEKLDGENGDKITIAGGGKNGNIDMTTTKTDGSYTVLSLWTDKDGSYHAYEGKWDGIGMEKSLRDSNKPLSAQETSNILHQFEQAYINHEQIARIKSNSNAIAQQNKQREIEAEEFFNDNEDARMV